MSSTARKLEAVGVTLTAATVGFFAAGPIGLGVGVIGGAIVDIFLLRKRATLLGAPTVLAGAGGVPGFVPGVVAQAVTPGGAGLPPGADQNAATQATILMSIGHSGEVGPAKVWLSQFQTSVGLPATGALDPATRSLLVLATAGGKYDASKLPATTILG